MTTYVTTYVPLTKDGEFTMLAAEKFTPSGLIYLTVETETAAPFVLGLTHAEAQQLAAALTELTR